MDSKIIQLICQDIYHRFPQVSGCRPTVSQQTGDQYLLVFNNQSRKSPQTPIATWVRVVVNEKGQILKISTSR